MKRKQLLCLILVSALLSLFLLPAAAAQEPDLSRTGSIRLTMRYEGKPVGGGELTLYQIATVTNENGWHFVPVSGMGAFDFSSASLESPEFASLVLDAAKTAGLGAKTGTIGSDGVVRFDALPLGLYLLEQTVSAPGFTCVRPFLVSIPFTEDGELIYDVDASPKPEPMKPDTTEPTEPTALTEPTEPSDPTAPTGQTEPTVPTNPTEPTKESKPTEPTKPVDKLPQTGQLNWPIPVLTIVGILCLLAGLLVLLHSKRESD